MTKIIIIQAYALDSDSDFVDQVERADGSGEASYEEIKEGGGEGAGLGAGGWIVSVCSMAVLIVAILVY